MENKNKKCIGCKYDCWVVPSANIVTCRAVKEEIEAKKKAKKEKGKVK